MKSTLIYYIDANFNYAELINTLISNTFGEISVVPATPKNLKKTIKSVAKQNENIFIDNEFLFCEEFNPINKIIFKNSEAFFSEDGKIIGKFSMHKGKKFAVIPCDAVNVEKFFNRFFNPISKTLGFNNFFSNTLKIATTDYNAVKQTLCEFDNSQNPNITVKKARFHTEVVITAFAETKESAEDICNIATQKIKFLLGDDVFAQNDDSIGNTVVKLLHRNNMKIATSESCTGGMLSQLITAVPNASSVFEIGLTSYSNRIKQYALSVPKLILNKYGAVSHQTAAYMALGVKNLNGANLGIGITGVAGPSSSEGKSVGTVYIALCDGQHFWVRKLEMSPFSTRDEIRNFACFTALDLTRRYLECLPQLLPDFSTNIENIECIFDQPHYINSSLLFLKNEYNDYLNTKKPQNPKTDIKFSSNNLFTINSASPLENLRKQVIKKHGVKKRFKLKINFSLKEFALKITSVADFKHFIYNYFIKLAFIILLSTAVMISALFISNVYAEFNNKNVITEMRANWNFTGAMDENGKFTDFNKLTAINPDISGWITIQNSDINYPVCSFKENDFYKTHNYKHEVSKFGALHFDKNASFCPANTIIYGNNPENGTMFSELLNYKELNFANNAQYIDITTPTGQEKYIVFAVLTATDNPKHEKGEFFDYTKTNFKDPNEFSRWLSEVKLRSIYDSFLYVDSTDKLLTLITDSSEFSSAKTVIIARAINDSDNPNHIYPLSVNSSPKFPEIWYNIHNLENPYN